jgi:8-oxo-dGTP diphosphatase
LDVTVGGHIDPGMDWMDTALKEIKEEAGLDLSDKDLNYVATMKMKTFDSVTGNTNNVIRNVYAYRFNGSLDDLTVEPDEAQGYEYLDIDKLLDSKEDHRKIIPALLESDWLDIYRKIKELIIKK